MLTAKELKELSPKSLAILGGTFDPIHNGHLYVCEQVMKSYDIEYLVLLPAKNPPHKNEREILDIAHRIAMTDLAIEKKPSFIVSDTDLREGQSYTVDTLRILKELLPQTEFFLILGGDSLMYVEKWYKSDELLKLVRIPVVYRPGDKSDVLEEKAKCLNEKYGADIILIDCEGMDISSSKIRMMVGLGEDINELVPAGVSEYIKKERLYIEE